MTTKTRKRISLALVACLALTLVVGSFAFFTDKLSTNTTGKAGSIDLVWADTSLKTGSNNTFAIDKVWDNHALVSENNIINPGDYFDLSYTLTNAGNKSMDVRQRLVLKSSVALTNDAEEYKLTITGGNDSSAVVPSKPDAYTLVYDLKDIILNGTTTGAETEATAVDGIYTIRLDFIREAKNAFMESEVTVNLYAAAKQHRNTTEADFPGFEQMAGIMVNANYETK